MASTNHIATAASRVVIAVAAMLLLWHLYSLSALLEFVRLGLVSYYAALAPLLAPFTLMLGAVLALTWPRMARVLLVLSGGLGLIGAAVLSQIWFACITVVAILGLTAAEIHRASLRPKDADA
jgi:hypothetical protein